MMFVTFPFSGIMKWVLTCVNDDSSFSSFFGVEIKVQVNVWNCFLFGMGMGIAFFLPFGWFSRKMEEKNVMHRVSWIIDIIIILTFFDLAPTHSVSSSLTFVREKKGIRMKFHFNQVFQKPTKFQQNDMTTIHNF